MLTDADKIWAKAIKEAEKAARKQAERDVKAAELQRRQAVKAAAALDGEMRRAAATARKAEEARANREQGDLKAAEKLAKAEAKRREKNMAKIFKIEAKVQEKEEQRRRVKKSRRSLFGSTPDKITGASSSGRRHPMTKATGLGLQTLDDETLAHVYPGMSRTAAYAISELEAEAGKARGWKGYAHQ